MRVFFNNFFLCLKNQYLVDVYTREMLVYLNILNFFLTHCSQLLNNNRINMYYSQRVVIFFCQFILLSKFFVTMAALIRFIPIIHYLIVNQITIMCKIFFTMVVFICFFLSVYFLMSYPITILTKKITMASLVQFFIIVYALVLPELSFWINQLSQWLHFYGLSPVYIHICDL